MDCINKYIKECNSLLPLHGNQEKIFIKNLRETLLEFQEEKGSIYYNDIIERFGHPLDIVYEYIRDLNEDTLMKNLNKRTLIKRGVILIIAIVTIISSSLAIYKTYQFNKLVDEVRDAQPVEVETIIE